MSGPSDRLFDRFPSLMMARRNLVRNRARTALAAIGILIGVVAIAGIGITGTALQESAAENLGDLTDEVTVFPAQEADEDSLTERQIRDLERIVPSYTVVAIREPETGMDVTVGSEEYSASIEGMSNPAALHDAQAGTIPTPFRSGALVGAGFADEANLRPGDTFQIDGQTYHVRAVLAEDPTGGFGFGGYEVIVPEDAIDGEGYSQASVMLGEDGNATQVAAMIEARMNDREEVVQTRSLAALQDQVSSLFQSLNTALLGVGSISLLVASVSILNVMLMSTLERRTEIGVLRAVGVPRTGVLRMVLAEAILLGVAGGLVGVALSVGIGLALNEVMFADPLRALQPANVEYYVMGFGFATIASTVSGLYPAWKAANDRPVDALRE